MSDYLTASYFSNSLLGSRASGGSSVLYMRNAVNKLDATADTAVNIGSLETGSTQLNVSGTLSKLNTTHYYKFSYDGGDLKASFEAGMDGVRYQLLNSSGTVVADSSTYASDTLQSAYDDLTSSDGLKLDEGDYTVKVTYDVTTLKTNSPSYIVSLYSGSQFNKAYETNTTAQTSSTQKVMEDDTLTYTTSDALKYSMNQTHLANETASSAIDLGYLYENKTALSATSQLTSTCDEEYYAVHLQKGENLKMALNNHTQTEDLRVQLYDSTGTYLIADSEGTAKQQAAYESMASSDGLDIKNGSYVIKVSYATGADKSKAQTYDFKVYSGTSYSALYQSEVGTEDAGTAILSGHLTGDYNPLTSLAASLYSVSNGEDLDIMSTLQSLATEA